jgi:hypothetical protein
MKEGIIVLAIHISKFAFLHLIQLKKNINIEGLTSVFF